jgi:hypothetical protein
MDRVGLGPALGPLVQIRSGREIHRDRIGFARGLAGLLVGTPGDR